MSLDARRPNAPPGSRFPPRYVGGQRNEDGELKLYDKAVGYAPRVASSNSTRKFFAIPHMHSHSVPQPVSEILATTQQVYAQIFRKCQHRRQISEDRLSTTSTAKHKSSSRASSADNSMKIDRVSQL
jgi:hypothetical protein